MLTLLLSARVWKYGAPVLGALAAIVGLHFHNDTKRERAAFIAGDMAARDSIAVAAHAVRDSMAGVIAERDAALVAARRATDAVAAHAARVAASHAATDALYASIGALSEPAKADTTVVRLEAAGRAVAAANDTLRHAVSDLTQTVENERAASDSLHSADTAALRALSVIAVGVRDSLAVEVKRPKRTWKSNVVAGAIGSGIAYGAKKAVEALAHSIQHKARK